MEERRSSDRFHREQRLVVLLRRSRRLLHGRVRRKQRRLRRLQQRRPLRADGLQFLCRHLRLLPCQCLLFGGEMLLTELIRRRGREEQCRHRLDKTRLDETVEAAVREMHPQHLLVRRLMEISREVASVREILQDRLADCHGIRRSPIVLFFLLHDTKRSDDFLLLEMMTAQRFHGASEHSFVTRRFLWHMTTRGAFDQQQHLLPSDLLQFGEKERREAGAFHPSVHACRRAEEQFLEKCDLQAIRMQIFFAQHPERPEPRAISTFLGRQRLVLHLTMERLRRARERRLERRRILPFRLCEIRRIEEPERRLDVDVPVQANRRIRRVVIGAVERHDILVPEADNRLRFPSGVVTRLRARHQAFCDVRISVRHRSRTHLIVNDAIVKQPPVRRRVIAPALHREQARIAERLRMVHLIEPEPEAGTQLFRRTALEMIRRQHRRRERIEIRIREAEPPRLVADHVLEDVRDARVIRDRRPHADHSQDFLRLRRKPKHLRSAFLVLECVQRPIEVSRWILPHQAESVNNIALCHRRDQLLLLRQKTFAPSYTMRKKMRSTRS